MKKIAGLSAVALAPAMLATTDYITVSGSGVDVNPSLATDVGHQLLN
ncbi:hypothetical protein MNB_SV-13-987 [hydrothermal vent metagenome]|uniref:Uncharacterized protein n=1 Tax=hydrothermal vent metagenome TaxID=652676 RepID=A0A1W1C4S7_9ZZZZ